MRKVTMEDLALQLGVARSTVSRALRDDPQIAPATRRRVHELAERLGYRPNVAARALTRRKAGVVGLLLPRSSTFVFANPYFSELLQGASEMAEKAGYPLLLSTDPHPNVENWLRGGRVDGLILLGSSVEPEQVPALNELVRSGFPLVLIHAAWPRLQAVTIGSNERAGIWQALAHLAQCGLRRVAFFAGPQGSGYAQRRERAYWSGLETFGLEVDPRLRSYGEDTLESGRCLCRKLLASRLPFEAILANNDLVAIGACQSLAEAGVAVPREVSVIGFDDTLLASLVEPPLTTIRQPVRLLGERAMEALLAMIQGGEARSARLATRLVVRGSTRRKGVEA